MPLRRLGCLGATNWLERKWCGLGITQTLRFGGMTGRNNKDRPLPARTLQSKRRHWGYRRKGPAVETSVHVTFSPWTASDGVQQAFKTVHLPSRLTQATEGGRPSGRRPRTGRRGSEGHTGGGGCGLWGKEGLRRHPPAPTGWWLHHQVPLLTIW